MTVTDVGEIAPLSPAEAVIVYVGIGAGVGSPPPPPPPQEIRIGRMNTGNIFLRI